jgi:hypothetical protein
MEVINKEIEITTIQTITTKIKLKTTPHGKRKTALRKENFKKWLSRCIKRLPCKRVNHNKSD